MDTVGMGLPVAAWMRPLPPAGTWVSEQLLVWLVLVLAWEGEGWRCYDYATTAV